MSGRVDDGLEHLRMAINLPEEDFADGIFAWRGFLYYKWTHGNISKRMVPVMNSILNLKPFGLVSESKKKYLKNSKIGLRKNIIDTIIEIRNTLSIYDESYKSLVIGNNPIIFRDFLISAPSLFIKLGHQLGMMNYICNFWNFRFDPRHAPRQTTPRAMKSGAHDRTQFRGASRPPTHAFYADSTDTSWRRQMACARSTRRVPDNQLMER